MLTTSGFFVGSGALNLGPYAGMAGTLPTHIQSSPIMVACYLSGLCGMLGGLSFSACIPCSFSPACCDTEAEKPKAEFS